MTDSTHFPHAALLFLGALIYDLLCAVAADDAEAF